MRNYWGCLAAVAASCVSQEQLNGVVTRSRDEFRNTEIVRAEVVMPTDEQNGRATIVVRGERGRSEVFLGLEIAGDSGSPRISCTIEVSAAGRPIDLPRAQYGTGSAGALTGLSPTMIMERFGVQIPVSTAETILTNSPRFRLCSTYVFTSTPAQADTFRRFWREFSGAASTGASRP